MPLLNFFLSFLLTTVALVLVCALLHALPKMKPNWQKFGQWLCRAPGLDLLMTIFSVGPLIVMPPMFGWAGLFGGIAGMYATLFIWTAAHEFAHPEARDGPRIVKVNNRAIGAFNNYAALLVTSIVVPMFWLIRMAEIFLYPFLIHLAKFPRYNAGDWVNVSRQKFIGLVGHDRVWCLYCDWMTGVWSLGSEMLRNVESFWCPVRFRSDLKCENCKIDFPDMSKWVDSSLDVVEASRLLEKEYLTEPRPDRNAWFGHPVRLTVNGKEPVPSSASPIPSWLATTEPPQAPPTPPQPVDVRPVNPPPKTPFAQGPIPLEPPKDEQP